MLQVDNLGNTLAEEASVRTGEAFTSVEAPSERSRWRFTHWTVSPEQPGFVNRDVWGRALDAVTVTPQGAVVTLTAVYADTAEDMDGDGVADAEERYWYGEPGGYDTEGSLAWNDASDTDGDGYTFAEELRAGMNPLFPNRLVLGGVATGDSAVLLYNPNSYPEVTIRSEPEGVFATELVVLRPGQSHTTDAFSPDDRFAQWTRNGVRQVDVWGRALDAVTVVGNSGVGKVELTAHFVDDAHTRLSRYWYGVDDQDGASDTDGDGYTFAEELQAGMNPLFPNTLVLGGVATGDGPTLETNQQGAIPVSAETPLSSEDADLLRDLLADRLGGVRAIRAEGTEAAILAGLDLGIVPATTAEDGTLTARFETPTLRIVAFDPQTGTARVRVIPAAGATLARPLATGVLQVCAAERLGEAMAPLEAEVDAADYLGAATLGEAGLTFSLGRNRFIKVVVERSAAQTAASPTQDRQP